MLNSRFLVLLIIIVSVALVRFLPDPPNFTPVLALAMFGGAYLTDKRMAFGLAFGALLLSDIFLGLHSTMLFVYACFGLMVYFGIKLQNKSSLGKLAGAGIGGVAGSVIFFIVTNFGVWLTAGYYPLTLEGLGAAYVAAIPFFHYTLASTLIYSIVLFGGFEFAQHKYPALQPALAQRSQ